MFAKIASAFSPGGQEHRSVIRAEPGRDKDLLEIGSQGELSPSDLGPGSDPHVPETACNNEYPLGKEGTSQCTEDHHNLIIDPEMCMQAAKMTNARIEFEHFELGEFWWDLQPKGCFAAPCEWSKGKMCYFYNPYSGPDDPCEGTGGAGTDANGTALSQDKVKCPGTPICFAPHYVNGTTNSNGLGNGTCQKGYQVVKDEDTCRASASCQGFCTGADFNVGLTNGSQHLDHPVGCFINKDDGCFYWNEPARVALVGVPSNPKGIPVCNATAEGHMWPA